MKKLLNMKSLVALAVCLLMVFLLGLGITENGPLVQENLQLRNSNELAPISVFIKKSEAPKLNKVFIKPTSTKKVDILNIKSKNVVKLIGVVNYNAKLVADQIREFNKESDQPIYLIIDSPGGSVVAGANLIAAMQASRLPVITICYNLCASMGAMIHQYGDRRLAVDKSLIMFHPAYSTLQGNVDVIHSFTRTLVRYIGKIELDVAKRLKMSYSQYKATTVNELWLDSEDALSLKVIDGIVDVEGAQSPRTFSLFGQSDEIEKLKKQTKLIWIYEGNL